MWPFYFTAKRSQRLIFLLIQCSTSGCNFVLYHLYYFLSIYYQFTNFIIVIFVYILCTSLPPSVALIVGLSFGWILYFFKTTKKVTRREIYAPHTLFFVWVSLSCSKFKSVFSLHSELAFSLQLEYMRTFHFQKEIVSFFPIVKINVTYTLLLCSFIGKRDIFVVKFEALL